MVHSLGGGAILKNKHYYAAWGGAGGANLSAFVYNLFLGNFTLAIINGCLIALSIAFISDGPW